MLVAGLLLMVYIGGNKKFTFVFPNQNIYCGYSKEPVLLSTKTNVKIVG